MLSDFSKTDFTHDGWTHPVYRGGSGPAVLVMHEIPGITPQVLSFAERVVAEGYTVFMPDLFGTPGKPMSNGYSVEQMLRACIGREFSLLAGRKSSRITQWLRALSRQIYDEVGGKGIGAIGMCITGNFALALMVDPWVMAPVLAEPSLPIPVPFNTSNKRELHLSDADLSTVKTRAREEGQCVLGLRFTGDKLCPPERFERLREELGEQFEGIEIDSSPGNPFNHPKQAHSVVTTHLVDETGQPTQEALLRVISFFAENLR